MSEAHPAQKVQIDDSWKEVLYEEFAKSYFSELKQFLTTEKQSGAIIYPPGKWIFHAFNATPFDRVKVVILGQDPYHGPGQAHGLSFSVPPEIRIPPSLRNIYQELQEDIGISPPTHGCLHHWAQQGVLLLNSLLTVRASEAGSHKGKGWEEFTSAAIRTLNTRRENLVFMLWGKYAQEKGREIDRHKHLVLTAPHPSPFSAHKGFFGCKHFSAANAYLAQHALSAIDWQV